jgi:hypothetical protein
MNIDDRKIDGFSLYMYVDGMFLLDKMMMTMMMHHQQQLLLPSRD